MGERGTLRDAGRWVWSERCARILQPLKGGDGERGCQGVPGMRRFAATSHRASRWLCLETPLCPFLLEQCSHLQ